MPISRKEAERPDNTGYNKLDNFLLSNSEQAYSVEELNIELGIRNYVLYYYIFKLLKDMRIHTTIKNDELYVWSINRR